MVNLLFIVIIQKNILHHYLLIYSKYSHHIIHGKYQDFKLTATVYLQNPRPTVAVT